MGMARIEKNLNLRMGFDFSIERDGEINRPYIAIWWCRGIDCGMQFGRRSFRFNLFRKHAR
jgi:hypothetical protein